MNQQAGNSRTAEFVRGFFLSLERNGIKAAVLHGWRHDFENELSDVDFAIEPESFERIAELIHTYCTSVGWILCQVLRHETTAAYCVCSAADDPSVAVALDACSDYRRNESVLLSVKDLLSERLPLPWGGYRANESIGLKYRFAKAAVKNKDMNSCTAEFQKFGDDARKKCSEWLNLHWSISLASWDSSNLGTALSALRKTTNTRPPLASMGSIKRIAKRLCRPTGMLLVPDHKVSAETVGRLEGIFGHLYFRRFRQATHWQPKMFKDLISSTLIVIPALSVFWKKFIPKACLYQFSDSSDFEAQCLKLAGHLHQRCIRQERLPRCFYH